MPLEHKSSQRAFEHNLKTELHHDKPKAQALAIAYSEKRQAEHHGNSSNWGPEPVQTVQRQAHNVTHPLGCSHTEHVKKHVREIHGKNGMDCNYE